MQYMTISKLAKIHVPVIKYLDQGLKNRFVSQNAKNNSLYIQDLRGNTLPIKSKQLNNEWSDLV